MFDWKKYASVFDFDNAQTDKRLQNGQTIIIKYIQKKKFH